MPVKFDQLLARADEGVLQRALGPGTIRLLDLIDPALSSTRRLRELVIELRQPEELLRDPEVRRTLLDLLPAADAEQLAAALGCPMGDPWAALRALPIRKNSTAERTLFQELGIVAADVFASPNTPVLSDASADYDLFAHQRRAARDAQALLDVAPNRLVLHMPTGSGKTRTAMHLASRQLRRGEPSLVVWLAFSEELCDQAAAEFTAAWSYLGDRAVPLYRYWGNRTLSVDEVGDGLMVAGLAKMYQAAKRSIDFITRLADRTSLVIIDEAHQAIAESYRTVLEVLVDRNPGTRLLGLTATPGRTWNDPDRDRELADSFGRQKVTLTVEGYDNPVDYLIAEGYLANPTFEKLAHVGDEGLTSQDLLDLAVALEVPDGVLERLAVSEQRNLLIINRIEQMVHQHARILVFAATVDHARLITTILQARGVDAAAVTATTPPGERMRLIARYKGPGDDPRVLVNYGVLTTGFDAPRTSAAIIARPTKSLVLYSQMVGRATRGPRAGGNAEALIVTVVDTALPGFGHMSDAFENWEDVW